MRALAIALAAAAAFGSCSRDRMTDPDCGLLFDHVEDRELAARGFRDPALARQRKAELRLALHDDLVRCTTIARDRDEVACVLDAGSDPELWTRCLDRQTR